MPYQIPTKNLLTNELHLTGSTIDLMRYDENLFSSLTLPEGLDRGLVIDTIIEKHGMAALAHPSPDWMKQFIGVWSKRHLDSWTKLYNTLSLKYNPIENYDRKEEISEKRTVKEEGSETGKEDKTSATGQNTSSTQTLTDSGEQKDSRSSESLRDVSAENATDYQHDTKDTGTGSSTTTRRSDSSNELSEERTLESTEGATSSQSSSHNTEDSFTHTNRTHGNIGVTTSQQMIQSERELVRYVIYEEIANDYRDAFCLDVY